MQDGVGVEVVQLHLVVVAERTDESTGGDSEPPLVQPHQAHDVAARGCGSLSADVGAIHTGRDGSVFGGRTPSATNDSRNAVSAVDLPHGAGSASCAITSMEGDAGGMTRMKGKVSSLLLFLFFLSLLGSSL